MSEAPGAKAKAANANAKTPRRKIEGHARKRIDDRLLLFKAYEEKKRLEDAQPLDGAPPAEAAPRAFSAMDTMLSGDEARKKLFSEIPRIEGDRVVLDRVVDADADALRDLNDNPLVQRYLPAYLFEKQFADAHEAIAQLYGPLFASKESLILAIRAKGTGELAGLAEFYGLRDSLHKVSMGYRLRERWWGHGFATETAQLMVTYLYGETDIEIIKASTMIENGASAHVLEKADFIRTERNVEEDWGFPQPTIVDKWFC